MKKILLALAILIFASNDLCACDVYTALLYTEGDDPTLESCEAAPAEFETVNIRLWIYNDITRGLKGFELGIDFNSTDVVTATKNPGTGAVIGDLTTTAFAGAFIDCQTDQWVWIVKYEMFYMGTPHLVEISLNSDTVRRIVTSCETNFPKYTLNEGNRFGVNLSCIVDSESGSWGAVKSIYR